MKHQNTGEGDDDDLNNPDYQKSVEELTEEVRQLEEKKNEEEKRLSKLNRDIEQRN